MKPNHKDCEGQFIPLSVPELGGNEWLYVKECLDTGWVSSVGAFVDRFEQAVAERTEAQYGIAAVNGTSALHIALQVAGIQPDDEVLVSTLTFIAPANAVRYVGAWPTFIDAEPEYWQMDTGKLVDFVEGCDWRGGALYNPQTGRRVRAIMPVHVLGHPVDMDPVLELARKYDLTVIEDASESLGSLYRAHAPGARGDIGCFSFNGNKIVTSGGGGMIVTNRADWAARAKHLTTQAKSDPVEYIHDEVGYNYRLTNVLAAMGLAQLEQLNGFVEAKRRIARAYNAAFSEFPGISAMKEAPWARSTYWMYTVLIDQKTTGLGSREMLKTLAGEGIQTRPLWQPMHLSPAHANSFRTDCAVAERLYRDALSLPCSAGLSEGAQKRVIEVMTALAGESVAAVAGACRA